MISTFLITSSMFFQALVVGRISGGVLSVQVLAQDLPGSIILL
jgi:hypothetical protein